MTSMYKLLFCLLLLLTFSSSSWTTASAASLLIRNGTTVCGQNTLSGFDDGEALTVAKLSGPTSVYRVPGTQTLLIGDSSLIRNLTNNIVTTIFGMPNQAGTVDGNKAASRVNSPSAFRAVNGKYYFTEPNSNVLRCIDGANVVTVAGVIGSTSAVDGVGTAATFQQPSGLALGSDGALYTADRGSNSIRRIAVPSMAVTTIHSVLAPSDIVEFGDMLYIINRPTGSSTIGIYQYNIVSGVGSQFIAATQAFVSLGSDLENRRLFGATQTRIYEIFMNGTIALYAGSGAAYANGVNPMFRSITQMYVQSYRAMYLATGASSYTIRGLFYDPPAPIVVPVTIAWPGVYFPTDNATEMAIIRKMLESMMNTKLGVSPLPAGSPSTDVSPLVEITSFTYDRTTNQIVFDASVPNMTYTAGTPAIIQDVTGYRTSVTQEITSYYAISGLEWSADYWTIPTGNVGAMNSLRVLMENDLAALFGYPPLRLADYSSLATPTDSRAIWQLLVPPSFRNSTSTALLNSYKTPSWNPSTLDLFPTASAFLKTYFVQNISAALNALVLPLHQPTIMYNIRQAVREDAATALGVQLFNVGNVPPATVSSTVYKILIPASSGLSNTTIQNILAGLPWSNVQTAIATAYPTADKIVFDGLSFPFSDPAAVTAMTAILYDSFSTTFGTNALSPEVFLLNRNPTIAGATGYQTASFDISALPSVTAAQLRDAINTAKGDPALAAYLKSYYAASSAGLGFTLEQLPSPVADPAAMTAIQHLIAKDLAAVLGVPNTGVNTSSPSFLFSATQPGTGTSLPSPTFPDPLVTVTFPILLPANAVNVSTAALINQAIAKGLPSVNAYLNQYYSASVAAIPMPAITPENNATAMEELRKLLVVRLRKELNNTLNGLSTDQILASANVLPYDSATNSFPIHFPAYLAIPPYNVNTGDLVGHNTETMYLTNDLPAYFANYYATTFSVQLPYDITPWSNSTTMNTLYQDYLLQEILGTLRVTYPQVASLSDAELSVFLRQAPTVSKSESNVKWELLMPPNPFATTNASKTQQALSLSSYPYANTFLENYFRKDLFVTMSGNDIPVSASILKEISVLLRNQLAANLHFENVGINNTFYDVATDQVYFKVIVPPQWNSTDLYNNISLLSTDPDATHGLPELIEASFAQNLSVFFAAGYLPESNTTAMEDIRGLLRLDIEEMLKYRPIGVAPFRNYTNDMTGGVFNVFDLRAPAPFSNGTTTAFFINATYPRVTAYLARYFPPAPAPDVFNYSVPWPVTIMPTHNATQMELLLEALILDAKDALGRDNITGFPFRLSANGQNVIYDILLPNELDNVMTGVTLENHGWPRFQQLLAKFNQGNLDNGGGATGIQAVDEGCSRGCVIAVAAIGAAIVTAGIIAAIVLTSKRKRLATVVASNGSQKNTEGRPPPPAFTPVFDDQSGSPAKNPLDMP